MTAERQLKCLLLPVGATALILPNSAVAEIVTLDEIGPSAGAPDWFLGFAAWRGAEVPLIAFDRLCGERQDAPPTTGRFVILFGLSERPQFYGMRIEALPRSEVVDDERLRATESGGQAGGYFIRARVSVDERACAVPDLDAVESAIAGYMHDAI